MSGYKTIAESTGRLQFSGKDYWGLPVHELVVKYTQRLVRCSHWHAEFIHLLSHCLGIKKFAGIFLDVFSGFVTEEKAGVIRNLTSPDELSSLVLGVMDRALTAHLDSVFRTRLAQALQVRVETEPCSGKYLERIERMQAVFGLSVEEMEILQYMACSQADQIFEQYCERYFQADHSALMAVALGIPAPDVRSKTSKNAPLMSRGLLKSRMFSPCVTDEVFEYLAGVTDDFLSSDSFSIINKAAHSLETFPVRMEEMALLLNTLRNPAPCHLFFYGRPGTGKTEMAKSLAVSAGKEVFLVKYGCDGDERDRRGAIMATLGSAPGDAVIIIDEADVLLNTATLFVRKEVDKGWINNFMDECRHRVIWIANERGAIESSVLRRFSYSVEFKKFTVGQRENIWRTQLSDNALKAVIGDAMIQRLSRDYEVDAGGVASALKATEAVFSGNMPSPAKVEKTLGRFLAHHEKLSGGERRKKKLNRLSPFYDVDALHTDVSARELIAGLGGGTVQDGQEGIASTVLFWGLPGTGKTEFAKYLAQELGRPLLVKRMSDLQSMWVGQTEKQIAEAFDEAEREGAILFLDEADSLILDRRTASRSWETSQTNEVLTQIENFNGICICCTNLLDGLDEAALRRFVWKVRFLPLTEQGREKLFRRYFQPKGRLSGGIRAALYDIRDLTPGDFKTVHERQRGRAGGMSSQAAVDALKNEVSYKRSRTSSIGFATDPKREVR